MNYFTRGGSEIGLSERCECIVYYVVGQKQSYGNILNKSKEETDPEMKCQHCSADDADTILTLGFLPGLPCAPLR